MRREHEKMANELKPSKDVLDVKGSVAYCMSKRAWNTIRLKKEILDEFSQLKERRMKISYRMVLYRNPVELFLAVEKIMDDQTALPILLYFTKEWPDKN